MFSKASCEYIVFSTVAQSVIALFVDSVEAHKEKTANADNNTKCSFSISWKIVKLFTTSMKKMQNALSVKDKKIVPATRERKRKHWR